MVKTRWRIDVPDIYILSFLTFSTYLIKIAHKQVHKIKISITFSHSLQLFYTIKLSSLALHKPMTNVQTIPASSAFQPIPFKNPKKNPSSTRPSRKSFAHTRSLFTHPRNFASSSSSTTASPFLTRNRSNLPYTYNTSARAPAAAFSLRSRSTTTPRLYSSVLSLSLSLPPLRISCTS